MKLIKHFILLMAGLFFAQQAFAQETPIYRSQDRFHPEIAKQGMVASQNHYASEVGLAVLQSGGNAVDAAVAVGFALAVTLPRAGNLGGGGFMLIYHAAKKEVIALDYRERAPKAATRTMFLDADGNADSEKSRYSLLSVGVPGTVSGLAKALELYGTMSLKEVIKPAIRLAEEGFVISYDLHKNLERAKERMKYSEASMKVFFKPDGSSYQPGEVLVQKDLAWSLKQIAKHGTSAFYEGFIAEKLVQLMQKEGGLITKSDLRSYEPVSRKPVQGTYHEYQIASMPPPSSGGIHLVQILNILEGFPISNLKHNTAETIHLLTESMKYAYADRSKYLGDPDFVEIPMEALTSKEYAATLREKINRQKATPSEQIAPGTLPAPPEPPQTTHFSVVDQHGNAVSNTYTLNFSYGNKIMIPGTGILLNNQMDDFSAKPGTPNAFGLIGGEFNAVAPEKRMLSSMSPTMVFKNGKLFVITGSPGGSRIITSVLQVLLNVMDHDMNIAEATNALRIHHQWLPDKLFFENGLNQDTLQLLQQKGHTLSQRPAMGSTQSIMINSPWLYGASDPRRPGALAIGY